VVGEALVVVVGTALVVVVGNVLVVLGGPMEVTASLVAAPPPAPEQAEATSRTAHSSEVRWRTVEP
jgi:hypothetical protein